MITNERPHNNVPASPARRAALYGVLAALALVAGYLEVLVPLPVTITGVKLGLGNAIVLFALERMGAKPAFVLMLIKVACSTMLFANPQMLAFSIAGGVLSWAIMAAAHKSGLFSTISVSVLGGIAHNAGQLAVAVWVSGSASMLYYGTVLAAAGVITGVFTGFGAMYLTRAAKKLVK